MDNVKYKNALVDFIVDQKFDIYLTLNWNKLAPLGGAREQLRNLFFRIDKKILGPRFNKMKASRRTRGVFFFEHVDANIHCHGLLSVDDGNASKFMELFPSDRGGIWNSVCASGSYWLKKSDNSIILAKYITKEVHINSDVKKTVWLDEFHPA